MPADAASFAKPGTFDRIFGRTLGFLVRIGLIRGHFYVLEVRGRRSGRIVSLPVDLLELDGRDIWSARVAIPTGFAMLALSAK